MTRAALILAFVGGMAVVLTAQAAPQSDTPAFEVASVKQNLAPEFLRFSVLPGDRLLVQGYTLASIIQHAFGMSDVRLVGMPAWAQSERFDITANAPQGATGGTPRVMAMLRTLLHARFSLRARLETQELPIYTLTRVAADGKLGNQLQPSAVDCSDFVPGRSEVPEPNAGPRCAITFASTSSAFQFRGRSMAQFASDLQTFAKRPVVDRTTLAGRYDIELAFNNQPPEAGASPSGDVLSLFTATQEQLGLKLEPSRGPVEVLVIDSVERPSPD